MKNLKKEIKAKQIEKDSKWESKQNKFDVVKVLGTNNNYINVINMQDLDGEPYIYTVASFLSLYKPKLSKKQKLVNLLEWLDWEYKISDFGYFDFVDKNKIAESYLKHLK